MSEFNTYETLAKFREPLIERIINSLNIQPDSTGIDNGCGIGHITNLLVKRMGLIKKMIGLDFSEELINYASRNSKHENIESLQGDVNHLEFSLNSFDWIWSMDTVWVGPKEFGCPAEEPDEILNQFYQILKPGGNIYLVFWTAQKLLPGYPLLEARLNASASANALYIENMKPDNHILNCKKWLTNANFNNIEVKTFVGDIVSPINDNNKHALSTFYQMFWGNSEK